MRDKIAFWSYDLAPYVLHSPIKSVNKNGTVTVVGYDKRTVKPIIVLNRMIAQELIDILDNLTRTRKSVIEVIDNTIRVQTYNYSNYNIIDEISK